MSIFRREAFPARKPTHRQSGIAQVIFDGHPLNPSEPYTPRTEAEGDEFDAMHYASQALQAAYIAMVKASECAQGNGQTFSDYASAIEDMESACSLRMMELGG